jgi:hypothetical protein
MHGGGVDRAVSPFPGQAPSKLREGDQLFGVDVDQTEGREGQRPEQEEKAGSHFAPPGVDLRSYASSLETRAG